MSDNLRNEVDGWRTMPQCTPPRPSADFDARIAQRREYVEQSQLSEGIDRRQYTAEGFEILVRFLNIIAIA
jgi:hypothetical protein